MAVIGVAAAIKDVLEQASPLPAHNGIFFDRLEVAVGRIRGKKLDLLL
jgi:hypothetical protein